MEIQRFNAVEKISSPRQSFNFLLNRQITFEQVYNQQSVILQMTPLSRADYEELVIEEITDDDQVDVSSFTVLSEEEEPSLLPSSSTESSFTRKSLNAFLRSLGLAFVAILARFIVVTSTASSQSAIDTELSSISLSPKSSLSLSSSSSPSLLRPLKLAKKDEGKVKVVPRRFRSRKSNFTFRNFFLFLLFLGGLTAGVCLTLKFFKVQINFEAPLRETQTAFEIVRHYLQLFISSLTFLLKQSSVLSAESETHSPPFSSSHHPPLPISLSSLKSILALQNTTLESAITEFCTVLKVENSENVIKENETSTFSSLTSEEDLQAACSLGLDWRKLSDRIQASLEATGSPLQLGLQLDEEDLREGQHLMSFSVGYLPPNGGSFSILKTPGSVFGSSLYQVELSASEDGPEERLEVAWILPFTEGKNGTLILLVIPDGRYCLLELFGNVQKPLGCKLTPAPSV